MAMGGVGEAALISAAIGGTMSAAQGGDPLKGALIGGLTGGALSGLGGALSSAGGEAAANVATQAGANAGANAAAQAGANAATQSALPGFYTPTSQLLAQGGQNAGIQSLAAAGAPAPAMNFTPSAAQWVSPTAPAGAQSLLAAQPMTAFAPQATAQTATQAATQAATEAGGSAFMKDPMAYLKANKLPLAGAAMASSMLAGAGAPELPGREEYNGPLKQFKYDPKKYRPGRYAEGGIVALARGGRAPLGGYSDGGQMLKGPGDGMSDSIPASIDGNTPARLANDEFVVPADVVSHLGNGSSDAGAKQLYAMMDRVRTARTGNKKQGRQIKPTKYMPG